MAVTQAKLAITSGERTNLLIARACILNLLVLIAIVPNVNIDVFLLCSEKG